VAQVTNMATLKAANWEQLELDVLVRIRLLRETVQGLDANKVTDRVAEDLVLPAVRLLAAFCECVEVQDG